MCPTTASRGPRSRPGGVVEPPAEGLGPALPARPAGQRVMGDDQSLTAPEELDQCPADGGRRTVRRRRDAAAQAQSGDVVGEDRVPPSRRRRHRASPGPTAGGRGPSAIPGELADRRHHLEQGVEVDAVTAREHEDVERAVAGVSGVDVHNLESAESMEFAANFMTADVPPAAWARRREAEGWHVLGCADHFFSPRRAYPHLWVTLATFAAATERVLLTPAFANNLFRSPVEFAQAALQMQAVSGGRFEAGLGAGWEREEAEAAGIDYPAGRRAGRPLRRGGAHRARPADRRHVLVPRPLLRRRRARDRPTCSDRLRRSSPPSAGRARSATIGPIADRIELQLISVANRGGAHRLRRARRDPAVASRRPRRARCGRSTRRCRSACSSCAASPTTSAPANRAQRLDGTFMGGFFGEPAKVAASLHELAGRRDHACPGEPVQRRQLRAARSSPRPLSPRRPPKCDADSRTSER